MLVGGVVGDQVEDQLQASRTGVGDQGVEVLKRPEQRVDRPVVRDVVAEVGHGRGEDRRDPDAIDAQVLEVSEPAADPREVAHTVAVGVLKRARVDLVDDAALPPFGLRHPRPSRAA